MDKDNIKAYQETCNTIRHYSNSSYNVRAIVIIQGLVLLGCWIINVAKASKFLLFCLSVSGIAFTVLLFCFYYGYYVATNFFYKLASKMEDELFDDNFKPFKQYDTVHQKKYKSCCHKIFILWAPFTWTLLIFIFATVITIFNQWQTENITQSKQMQIIIQKK